MPTVTANAGDRDRRQQPGRDPGRRQDRHGRHHQRSTTAAQSSQRIRVRSSRVRAARNRRTTTANGDDQAERDERVRDRQQGRPHAVGQRDRRRVQVEPAVDRRHLTADRPRPAPACRREEQRQRQQGGGAEADQRRDPPPAGGQPAVRVEQQQERQREQQGGAEPLVDPERERAAGQRRVGARWRGRARTTRRRRAPSAPRRRTGPRRPGGAGPGGAGSRRGWRARGRTSAGDPARFGDDLGPVGGVAAGVEQRREHDRRDGQHDVATASTMGRARARVSRRGTCCTRPSSQPGCPAVTRTAGPVTGRDNDGTGLGAAGPAAPGRGIGNVSPHTNGSHHRRSTT